MGVASGMTLRQAQALCPQARFISADPARYQQTFDTFLEVLTSFTPRLEPDGPQPTASSYLDLGHLERAEAVEMARGIGQTVREEIRLAPAIGLAEGKFPAYVAAASVGPNKALLVAAGHEAAFLAPFPVDVLPLDGETARWLQLLGIHSLGQLAALPVSAVLAQFGMQGRLLHRLALGCDDRPVLPHQSKAMESASRQLDGPVANRVVLEAVVQAMAVELADRLQARGLTGQELRLILHLEDRTTRRERLVMRQPTGDPERLARILGELTARVEVGRGIMELEVSLTGLAPARGQQLDLFVHQTGQEGRLRRVLRDLIARYGADCFYRVSLPDREARLPERRFQLQKMEAS